MFMQYFFVGISVFRFPYSFDLEVVVLEFSWLHGVAKDNVTESVVLHYQVRQSVSYVMLQTLNILVPVVNISNSQTPYCKVWR